MNYRFETHSTYVGNENRKSADKPT